MPEISVVMPVYNAEQYLLESIESILFQSYEDFELIIINDGSTDASKDIALSQSDKRIKYLENKKNQGLIKSLNKGLHYAQGQYIARMDADDMCKQSRFEKQINYFKQNPAIDILGTAQYIINSRTVITHKKTHSENLIELLLQPAVGHSTVMIKKQPLIMNKLYYDKNALYAEDYKLWIDAALCGLIINNIDDCLCGYRLHEKQITRTKAEHQRFTADKIRIAYAKSRFGNIINGNEMEYLCLIHGVTPQHKELYSDKVHRLYSNLLLQNKLAGHFDNGQFIEFMERCIIKFTNC